MRMGGCFSATDSRFPQFHYMRVFAVGIFRGSFTDVTQPNLGMPGNLGTMLLVLVLIHPRDRFLAFPRSDASSQNYLVLKPGCGSLLMS